MENCEELFNATEKGYISFLEISKQKYVKISIMNNSFESYLKNTNTVIEKNRNDYLELKEIFSIINNIKEGLKLSINQRFGMNIENYINRFNQMKEKFKQSNEELTVSLLKLCLLFESV